MGILSLTKQNDYYIKWKYKMSNLSKIANIEVQETKPLSSNNVYYKGESYTGSYSIFNEITYPINITFASTLNEAKAIGLPLQINRGERKELSVSFTPESTGDKKFEFFVTHARQKTPLLLLEKTMLVQEKEDIKKPTIEASVQSGLPSAMKLGQRANVIFLFTNTGEGEATGISIEIKQIRA
jgi:hypothetical protein